MTTGGDPMAAGWTAAALARDAVMRLRAFGAFAGYAGKRFWTDGCPQVSAALTYTSLLSLVPLTAITLAILTAFPVFSDVREAGRSLLFEALVPQVSEVVFEHLERFAANAGQLTSLGIMALIVTALLLLATIEAAFNRIWRVREGRPFLVRFLSFWAVLTLTPLLFAASISLSSRLLGAAETTMGGNALVQEAMPFLFQSLAFALLYRIIPNRSVSWRDAICGGLLAAVLFNAARAGYVSYLNQFPVYETVYGALATIPTFLIWLYLVWSTILLGAVVTASLPDFRAGRILGAPLGRLEGAQRAAIAVAVLSELYDAVQSGRGCTRRDLHRAVPVGAAALDLMLDRLRSAKFVARGNSDRWYLVRDPHKITLDDTLKALGFGLRGDLSGLEGVDGPWRPRLFRALTALEGAEREILGLSLARLFEPDTTAEPVLLPDRRRGLPGAPAGSAPASSVRTEPGTPPTAAPGGQR